MTTAETPEQSPYAATPEQLRGFMRDAETLLNIGTLDYVNELTHQTKSGLIYYKTTEILGQEQESIRSAEIIFTTETDEALPELLDIFLFNERPQDSSRRIPSRKEMELARTICIERLEDPDISEDEAAILLFVARDYAARLEGIPNSFPSVTYDSRPAALPLEAMHIFVVQYADQRNEILSYTTRRPNGDYLEVNHSKGYASQGEPLGVRTEIHLQDAEAARTYSVICQDEKFEESLAYTVDHSNASAIDDYASSAPLTEDIERLAHFIKAEMRVLDPLSDLIAKADTDCLDYLVSPKGSMAETIASIRHEQSFAQLKRAFELQNRLVPVSFDSLDVHEIPDLELRFAKEPFRREVDILDIAMTSCSVALEDIPDLRQCRTEMIYASLCVLTKQGKINPFHLHDAGIAATGYFKVSHPDQEPVYISGSALLRDITSISS